MKLLFLSSFFSLSLNIGQKIIQNISKILVLIINFFTGWSEAITELMSQDTLQLKRLEKIKQWRAEKEHKCQMEYIRNLDDLC